MKNKRIQETIYEFDSDSNVICIYQKQRNKPTGIATFSKDKIILGEYFCEEDTSELEILISNLDPKFILFYCNSDKSIKNIVFNLEKERIIYLKHFSLIYTELVENLKSLISFSFDNEISLNSRVFEILEGLGEGGLQALNSLIIFLKSKNFSSTKLIFEKVEFENIMIVSQKTLRDLLIFDEKLHPSQVKGKGRSKEGLSLYSFFNKAITSQGKRFMKNLFLFPAKNINTINSRLDFISDFYAIQNLGLTKRLIEELKNVNDVEKIVSDLTKFNINYRIWGNLWKTTNSFLSIFEIFNQFPKERFKLLQNLYSKLNSTNIQSMIDLISGCFDFYKEDVKPKLKVGINEDMDK